MSLQLKVETVIYSIFTTLLSFLGITWIYNKWLVNFFYDYYPKFYELLEENRGILQVFLIIVLSVIWYKFLYSVDDKYLRVHEHVRHHIRKHLNRFRK